MNDDGLQWIAADRFFELGYWLVFARDLGPNELAYRLGGELAASEPISWRDGAILENADDNTESQAIRLGSYNAWTFAVGWYGSMILDCVSAAQAASIGTLAISFERNVNSAKWFVLARDGLALSTFGVPNVHLRSGAEPDLLLPDLQEVGLILEDGTAPIQHGTRMLDSEDRVLRLLESRFNLGLPADIKNGSFLTALLED